MWLLHLHTNTRHTLGVLHCGVKQSVNQQPSLTFVRAAELFTPRFALHHRSRQRCQSQSLAISHLHIFPLLLAVFPRDFSRALNYSLLAPCFTLPSTYEPTAASLRVPARVCCATARACKTPLICARVPGGCWINRMPTR